MDTTLSTDAASSNIMNNTMEGLYRLGKDDKLVPGVQTYDKMKVVRNTYLNYVMMRSGLMGNL